MSRVTEEVLRQLEENILEEFTLDEGYSPDTLAALCYVLRDNSSLKRLNIVKMPRIVLETSNKLVVATHFLTARSFIFKNPRLIFQDDIVNVLLDIIIGNENLNLESLVLFDSHVSNNNLNFIVSLIKEKKELKSLIIIEHEFNVHALETLYKEVQNGTATKIQLSSTRYNHLEDRLMNGVIQAAFIRFSSGFFTQRALFSIPLLLFRLPVGPALITTVLSMLWMGASRNAVIERSSNDDATALTLIKKIEDESGIRRITQPAISNSLRLQKK